MRYAVIHCRNSLCSRHVMVPKHKLGLQGKCPKCGHPMPTPRYVPDDCLVDGPLIMEDFNDAQAESARDDKNLVGAGAG